jgi:hypothetical protein
MLRIPNKFPKALFWSTPTAVIRVASGLVCPHCQEQIGALDINVGEFGRDPIQTICPNPQCGQDVLMIEPAQRVA